MIEVVPYIIPQNSLKAIKLYEELFNAKLISHQPFSKDVGEKFGFPANYDYKNSTMHAEINIDGSKIYLSDDRVKISNDSLSKVEIVLNCKTKEQIDTFYENANKFKCKIVMKLQETFWGGYYARFADPFGISWQLNYQNPDKK